MKKYLVGALSVIIILFIVIQTGLLEQMGINPIFKKSGAGNGQKKDDFSYMTKGDIKYRVKAEGNYFYFYNNGKWEKEFMRGVNIGAGEPGIFPGQLTISYEEYYRWFGYISAMNANCIRVYTTMRPQFYNALLDFNRKAKNPIYLFQGVWVNEQDVASFEDVYAQNGKIITEFTQDAKNLVDIIHGDSTLPLRAGFASGTYTADVSKYLAGWLIGTEWDPMFVQTTNESNPEKNSYDGKYLYTLSATPFESFLCHVGDDVIQYESEKYKYQTTVGFTNWVTTDPLTHPNEPHPDEDRVTVNMENIKSRDAFVPNQFAAYHVYPYYPDSMNYQTDYINYTDEYGKKNPYRAYLKELKMAHTMPVLVAEFGIPTSRGMAHKSELMGYNQGFIDETRQGEMLADMMNSMYEENYAGGLVFAWQDEWFKRTWNTVKFDIPDKRPFWSNIQTNEQSFGILAFDPGESVSKCYVDGNISDWKGDTPVAAGESGKLFMKSDERYVYFMVQPENYNFDTDSLYIPLDTIGGQGNLKMNGQNVSFDAAADFVIAINGKENSRIVVDAYYDSFYFLYGEQYQMIDKIKNIRSKNTGTFNTMQMCYNYELSVPPKNQKIPFKSYETGKLQFGNANPNAKNYESLADFCYKDGNLEIRIPWQLLNVMDPSGKKIMDDLYATQNIVATDAQGFSLGFGVKRAGIPMLTIALNGKYDWNSWTMPTYHERLKPSYYVLQKRFKDFK